MKNGSGDVLAFFKRITRPGNGCNMVCPVFLNEKEWFFKDEGVVS
jgi:hypothetical protein